jgi:hypothetical protein
MTNDPLIGTPQQRFYFAIWIVVTLTVLAVALFITLRGTIPTQLEWLAFYTLVGFIGGILFYVVDPLRTQSFQGKGFANLTGAAAIGAAFMFLASELTPPPSLEMLLDAFRQEAQRLEASINKEFGDSIKAEVSSASLVIDVSNYSLREQQNIDEKLRELSNPKFETKTVFHPPTFRVTLMDSVLPPLIYNSEKGSNAAVLVPLLKDLEELELNSETTSPGWDLHEQVFNSNPDLIIIHASSFLSHTRQPEDLEQLDRDPFNAFLKYMASKKTKFLVYSRVLCPNCINEEDEARLFERLDSRLKGRVTFFYAQDSFRTTAELTRFKQEVKDILKLP